MQHVSSGSAGLLPARSALPLKRSREGLDRERLKLMDEGAVRPEWTCVTPKVLTTMKRVLSALVVSGGIALVNGAPYSSLAGAPIPEVGGAPLQSIAPVVSRVTPGVVGISVRGRVREDNPLLQDPLFRRFFNMQQQPMERETQATGSGVIVDAAQGYVLTNSHVVENASSIEVTTKDNRRLKAKLIGRDPETDIAVLQIPIDCRSATSFLRSAIRLASARP